MACVLREETAAGSGTSCGAGSVAPSPGRGRQAAGV